MVTLRRERIYEFLEKLVRVALPRIRDFKGIESKFDGKGKGAPEGFVAPVTPGRIIIEAEGVSCEIAKEALRLAAQKLPITTKFVVRRDYDIQNQNA